MASLCTRSDGSQFIAFMLDGKRKTVSVGSLPTRIVETIQNRIEDLVAAAYANRAPDAETANWLGKIDAKLTKKLVKVGLIDPPKRKESPGESTLDAYLASYLATRQDVKASTRTNASARTPAATAASRPATSGCTP